MNPSLNIAKQEFTYHKLSTAKKLKMLKKLKERFEGDNEIMFAYVHGSFLEKNSFRDIDIAIWLKNPKKAFHYTVNFSTILQIQMKLPIDLQVLNEAPLPYKYNIFTKGKLLFSKNENLRTKIIDETIRKYIDLKYITTNTLAKPSKTRTKP